MSELDTKAQRTHRTGGDDRLRTVEAPACPSVHHPVANRTALRTVSMKPLSQNTPIPLIDRVAAQIRARCQGESSGHDWHHIDRVWTLARRLAIAEGADLQVVELAALVHDIADWKFHAGDDSAGPRAAQMLLADEGAAHGIIGAVVDIVATLSFKGAGVRTAMRSIEGQCVQDADRLGAIGIARCFAYGGHAGRLIHDPQVAPVMHASAEAYKAAKGTSLNHFYEKLLLLKDRMNTASGRRIAEERHAYMAQFVARFLGEWNGER